MAAVTPDNDSRVRRRGGGGPAALIIAIVPISILIAVFQERVVGALTSGGVKG